MDQFLAQVRTKLIGKSNEYIDAYIDGCIEGIGFSKSAVDRIFAKEDSNELD